MTSQDETGLFSTQEVEHWPIAPSTLQTAIGFGAIAFGFALLWSAKRADHVQRDLERLPARDEPSDEAEALAGPRWTPSDIRNQLGKVRQRGWLSHFVDAANSTGFTPETLLGIGSRESNIEQIIGDNGHGHGIMQIDDRSFPEFVRSGKWRDPRLNVFKGAQVLAGAYNTVRRGQGRQLTCTINGRRVGFVGVRLGPGDLLRTALAAYNSGCRAYYWMSVAGDPDRGTTGRDYSRDTLARAAEFKRLLGS